MVYLGANGVTTVSSLFLRDPGRVIIHQTNSHTPAFEQFCTPNVSPQTLWGFAGGRNNKEQDTIDSFYYFDTYTLSCQKQLTTKKKWSFWLWEFLNQVLCHVNGMMYCQVKRPFLCSTLFKTHVSVHRRPFLLSTNHNCFSHLPPASPFDSHHSGSVNAQPFVLVYSHINLKSWLICVVQWHRTNLAKKKNRNNRMRR